MTQNKKKKEKKN